MTWKPIETAPKDRDILVWYDHAADKYVENEKTGALTDYAANAESGSFLDGHGVAIAKWCPQSWEAFDEYGGGCWLPAGWFSRGDSCDYEAVCNATHWGDLPSAPE